MHATTHGTGPFYPAIRVDTLARVGVLHVCLEQAYDNEDEACEVAQEKVVLLEHAVKLGLLAGDHKFEPLKQ
jgi:hypothetical protein